MIYSNNSPFLKPGLSLRTQNSELRTQNCNKLGVISKAIYKIKGKILTVLCRCLINSLIFNVLWICLGWQ
jgi:hypothetical protein